MAARAATGPPGWRTWKVATETTSNVQVTISSVPGVSVTGDSPLREVDGEVPGRGGAPVPAGGLPGAVLDLTSGVAELGVRLRDGQRPFDVEHVPGRLGQLLPLCLGDV